MLELNFSKKKSQHETLDKHSRNLNTVSISAKFRFIIMRAQKKKKKINNSSFDLTFQIKSNKHNDETCSNKILL